MWNSGVLINIYLHVQNSQKTFHNNNSLVFTWNSQREYYERLVCMQKVHRIFMSNI